MKRDDLTEKLLDIKREKGWTWKHICEQIGGMSPVMITGALLGNHKLTKPQAAAAAKLFGLSKTEQTMLNEVPMRGAGTPMPPTDPLIYRFYELVMVNGPAWKALIEEEFGDGIMSAIDFDMVMERLRRPEGRPRQDLACRASSCRSNITARPATRRRMGIRRSRGARAARSFSGSGFGRRPSGGRPGSPDRRDWPACRRARRRPAHRRRQSPHRRPPRVQPDGL